MADSMERSYAAKETPNQQKQSSLHSISCTHCRQRKVKCNRVHPCLQCQRSGFECIFPERAKHPKRKKAGSKTSTQEMLDRLSRMEKLIGTIEPEAKNVQPQDSRRTSTPPWMSTEEPRRKSSLKDVGFGDDTKDGSQSPTDGLNRYIAGGFWRTLTSEVEGLRQTIDEDESEDDNNSPFSNSETQTSHSSVMFGSAYSTAANLRNYHPTQQQIHLLSEAYIRNVDPVFKILHVPSFRQLISNVISNLDTIPTDNYVEPFLFAVYYATITTFTNDDCFKHFQDTRDSLLVRYRSGFERALTNADFLNSTEIGILQALCIFLISLRSNDDTQCGWTLFAVVVRLAQGIGLHRESMGIGMSPFAMEMRRRLWWQMVVLDIRNSEDRGSDPIISPSSFNTRKPANIDDVDITPGMTTPPPDRYGYTEMSKCHVSHEVSLLRWQFGEIPIFDGPRELSSPLPVAERIARVSAMEKSMNEMIIRHCDPSVPIQWVTSVVTRLIMCRMRLLLYHPIDNGTRRPERPHVSNEKLLETAVACMEYSHLLDTEPKAAHWRWFFKTYVQWHSLATTLAELCIQTRGVQVERAWRIVDTVFDDWAARIADSRSGMLWRPMKKLMAKAQAKRAQTRSQAQDQSQPISQTQSPSQIHAQYPLQSQTQSRQDSQSHPLDLPHQQPLPTFSSLSFEPTPLPATTGPIVATGDPSFSAAGLVTPLEDVDKRLEMAAFDGFEGGMAGSGADVGSGADMSGVMGSVGGMAQTGADYGAMTSTGEMNADLAGIRTGSATNMSALSGEQGGEINWSEWDEFVQELDLQDLGGKDVDMLKGGQGQAVDVWW